MKFHEATELTEFRDKSDLRSRTRGYNLRTLLRMGFQPSQSISRSGCLHVKLTEALGHPSLVFGVRSPKRSLSGDFKFFSLEKSYDDTTEMHKDLARLKSDLATSTSRGKLAPSHLKKINSLKGSVIFKEMESSFRT